MNDARPPAIVSLERLRSSLADPGLSLPLEGAATQRDAAASAVRQIDDYIRPRLADLDAPLLAVVGGSTGSGKSTIVNAIIGTPTTRAGVIRPTTRQPILVHAPVDAGWFASDRILPGLARVRGRITEPGTPASSAGDVPTASRMNELMLLASDQVPASLALVDAPDIDSVADENRALANQLLAAADLWLFVTTANRYADAVPWALLDGAASRAITVAVVLNRVPPGAADEVLPDLKQMLSSRGLPDAPVFVIEEQPLDDLGMLPAESVAGPRTWLTGIAADRVERARIAARTLRGAIVDLDIRVASIATARQQQLDWLDGIAKSVALDYDNAADAVDDATRDGALLRGEVLARWQDFVGTGEFFKKVESGVSRLRDRLTGALTGKASQPADVGEALQVGVAQLIEANADAAAAEVARAWRALPAGSELIAAQPGLAASDKDFSTRVDAAVRAWQGEVLDVVRSEGQDRRTNARVAAYGVNGIGLFLMLVAFAHTGGLMGAEVGIAGGTAVLAQRVLEAIFGDQAVRTMAAKARSALLEHTERLIGEERDRYLDAVGAKTIPTEQTDRLSRALDAVQAAS